MLNSAHALSESTIIQCNSYNIELIPMYIFRITKNLWSTYGPRMAVPTNVCPLWPWSSQWNSWQKWCTRGSVGFPIPNLCCQSIRGHPWGEVDPIFAGGGPVRGALERLFIAGLNASAALPIDNNSHSSFRPGHRCGMIVCRPHKYHVRGGEAAGGPQLDR